MIAFDASAVGNCIVKVPLVTVLSEPKSIAQTAGSPVAEGTLSERAQQVYEEDKSKLPINVPVTNPTDPFAQAPSYVKPDYSRVGTQKP